MEAHFPRSTGGSVADALSNRGIQRKLAMNLPTMIFRNLTRRPLRSLLTIAAVAIAVGAVVALGGIVRGLEDSFLNMYTDAGIDLVVLRAGAAERLASTLDERLAARIARLPGVTLVVPSLLDVVSFDSAGLVSVPIRAVPPGSPVVSQFRLQSGRHLEPGDRRTAVLGRSLAAQLAKRVGDSVRLYDEEDFRVVGIYETGNVFDNGSLVVPLADLQRLMDREGEVTGFLVRLKPPATPAEVAGAAARIEGLKSTSGKPLGLSALSAKDHAASIAQLQLARDMSWVTMGIALAVGSIGVLNTMFMSVFERTREIGVLRAIGWRRRRIIRMVLGEALAVSVAGCLVGAPGAVLLVKLLGATPAAQGLVSGQVAPWVVVEGVVLGLAVGVLGVLYPAWYGARITPADALRHG